MRMMNLNSGCFENAKRCQPIDLLNFWQSDNFLLKACIVSQNFDKYHKLLIFLGFQVSNLTQRKKTRKKKYSGVFF